MPLAEAAESCRHAWARDALRLWAQAHGWPLLPAPGAPAPPEA
jgi:hypothetical protein